jgi:AraC-like DNA-binding protein
VEKKGNLVEPGTFGCRRQLVKKDMKMELQKTAMGLQKTTLEDIAAVVGFTATLRLSSWFGDGTSNCYVPLVAEEGQLIERLIGLPAATALSREWGGDHLAIPRLRDYEDDMRKKAIGRMFEKGFGSREIAAHLRISERRVQQICRELEVAGLIEIVGPRECGENAPENEGKFAPQKMGGKAAQKIPPGGSRGKNAPKNQGGSLPAGFFTGRPK